METKIIARVNNVDIVSTSDEQLVPLRPICEALGIAFERQTAKITADGKQREMLCLPLEFIFGWLFTINPANVNEDAKPTLIKYQHECYHALFLHFTARAQFVEQKQIEIDRQLSIVDDAKEHFRTAKNILSEAEAKLKQLRSLTMNDYDIESRQLKIDF